MIGNSLNLIDEMRSARADYDAVARTRYVRDRSKGIYKQGTGADYHIRNETDLYYMTELSRALCRNDTILGPAIEKTVAHCVQGGYELVPQSTDNDLNKEIKERFDDWAKDPSRVDYDSEFDFRQMERGALRGSLRDGESYAFLRSDQRINVAESHRIRKPTRSRDKRCFKGVKVAAKSRRHVQYWLANDAIDPFKQPRELSEVKKLSVYDEKTKLRIALQVCDTRRKSQTRCAPVLAPIITTLSQINDTMFAKLVQQQATSVFAFIRERAVNAPPLPGQDTTPGNTETVSNADGSTSSVTQWGPAMEYAGAPGESIKAFAPDIPSSTFFEHMKLMLQLVNIHLSLPLVLYLLDASETNFSGWRGALEAAKIEFRRVQELLEGRFHRHVILWWLWLERLGDRRFDNRCSTAFGDNPRRFPHRWQHPIWPSIQPLDDAMSHTHRRKTLQVSPRDAAAELGTNWRRLIDHTTEDNYYAIEKAVEAAAEFKKQHGLDIDWQLFLTLPSISDTKFALDSRSTTNADPVRPPVQ